MTVRLTRRTAAAVLAATTALTLSGCVKQQSDMTISKKERVTGSLTMLVHNDAFELMQRFDEDPERAGLSPAEYRKAVVNEAGTDGSVRVPKSTTFTPLLGKTYSGVKVNFRNASFSAVNRLGSDIAQDEETPGKEKAQFRVAKNRKKQVVFTYRVDAVDLDSFSYKGPKPSYKVVVTMPGKVLKHNGKLKKRTVTWKGTPSQKKVKVLTATAKRK